MEEWDVHVVIFCPQPSRTKAMNFLSEMEKKRGEALIPVKVDERFEMFGYDFITRFWCFSSKADADRFAAIVKNKIHKVFRRFRIKVLKDAAGFLM